MQNLLRTQYDFLDLTHNLTAEVPTWDNTIDFKLSISSDYDCGYRQQTAQIEKIGVGTHIDAPSHFCQTGCTVDQLALEDLITNIHALIMPDLKNEDYELSVQDIKNYEAQYGAIREQSLFIFASNWQQHWFNPVKFRNCDERGQMHFPCFSLEAAHYLLEKDIAGIGIDTLSPETGAKGFPIHNLLLGAGKYILENLANCQKLPAQGAQIIALPPKIANATEAPLRVIALIPK